MTSSPIFVVGCPRSGTNLLRNLLRSHPRLAFPPESHFIPRFYRAYGHPRTEQDAVALAARLLRLPWIRHWDVELTAEEFAGDRTFTAVVGRLFGAWARKEGKPRWGDKTPHYVQEIPVLLSLFPAGRVIHIIRDGRDVARSWLKAGFEPRNLFTAATLWKQYVSAGREAGRSLPREAYMEVRYEGLLEQPETTMRSVCAFVDEPFGEAVLRPSHVRGIPRSKIIGGVKPERSGPDTITPPRAGWAAVMPPADRLLFESVAGDLLGALGYEVSGATRPISRVERVGWVVHHRLGWAVERLNLKEGYRRLLSEMEIRWATLRARRRRHAPAPHSR